MADHSVHGAIDLAGDEREALRRAVLAQAQEIGSRAQGASEEETDALLDAAFAAARDKQG